MDIVRHIGFAAVAGAAVLALTAGAAAALPAPSRLDARPNVVAVHGCHVACVKTGPGTAHKHVPRSCGRVACGRQPSPPPPRR